MITATLISLLALPAKAQTATPQAPSAAPTAAAPGDPQQTGDATYRLSVNANIVLTNVVVRDKKTGAVVKGLKASDFTILEDKKPQRVVSFDYQNVDDAATLNEKSTVSGKGLNRRPAGT